MTEKKIEKVGVIGAGTMGGGIAAHLANLGFNVTLFDVSQPAVVEGFERTKSSRPPHFYAPDRANDVHLANIGDHLHLLSEVDWVCEAVVERMAVKKSVYEALEGVVRPDTLITTNTSGLEIGHLAEGRSESFRRQFLGAHFFNPPRHLKLLELIPTAETNPEVVSGATRFFERHVARRVVVAKDTPGFIANRYGMWSMFHATHVAEQLRFDIEDVDAITGPFLGRPKSGSFRLNDIVGLDVMRDIAANLLERCPDDPAIQTLRLPNSVFELLARGWLGDKAGQGYYRKESRELLALDLATFVYRQRREPQLKTIQELGRLPIGERIGRALEGRDEVGEFLREYLVPALHYANAIKQEISHSVNDFDRVMRWGFGWELGPFQLIDAIGAEKLGLQTRRFYDAGRYLSFDGPYAEPTPEPDFQPLSSFPVVAEGETLTTRDLGDGVTAVSLKTKMGVISPAVVAELTSLLAKGLDRFVLTSDARSFSAGFDLKFFAEAIEAQNMESIDAELNALQRLGEALEARNVVAAIYGHCLGAGLELALSCGKIVAAAETQIGLPESRVGLIPGGRGVTLMRLYNQHSARRLSDVCLHLIEGSVASNADMARQMGYLRPADITEYHPDLLIHRAKAAVIASDSPSRPIWQPTDGPLVGMIDRDVAQLRQRNVLSDYDDTIGVKIRSIFARATSYQDALVKERSEFLDLCGKALTQARIRHMLDNGRPLRN